MAEQEQREQEVVPGTTAGSAPEMQEPVSGESAPQPDVAQEELPRDNKAWAEMRVKAKEAEDYKARVQELEEQLLNRQQAESAFESLRPKPNYNVISPELSQFTDPNTGEIDWNRYDSARRAEIEAARYEAQTARTESAERLDEFEARQVVPELADKDFEELVAAKWLKAKMEGKPASIKNIALDLKRTWNKASSKQQQQLVQEALETASEKEKASLAEIGQSNAAAAQANTAELDQLRARSRSKENPTDAVNAIHERLKSIPWGND